MEPTKKEKNITDAIVGRIMRGEVSMRPRWHFILRAVLVVLGAVLLFLAALYLVSFVIFITRQSGTWYGPAFGMSGWMAILRSVPWFLLALALLFVIVIEVLVRQYAFTYRKPLIYSAVALVGGTIIMSSFIAPFHRQPFRDARMHRLSPPAGQFYEMFGGRRAREIHRGIIQECDERSCVIEDFRGETSTVILPPLRFERNIPFVPGDEVVVMGVSSGTTVHARAVRRIEDTPR